jgi:Cofactor assembly of complex C subunit B
MLSKRRVVECLAIASVAWIETTVGFAPTRSGHSHPFVKPHRMPMIHATTTMLSATPWLDLFHHHSLVLANVAPPEVAGISYSKASYYTVLGLYLMSFPGVWSQIKRSTEAKVKRKTFVSNGEKNTSAGGLSLRQQAGEIMACTLLYGCDV